MHFAGDSYDDIYATFRWELPGRFNMAVACCGDWAAREPDRVAQMRGAVPMKREGKAGEVAGAILWLLSDEASYTTGALLDVGGGR